MKHDPVLSPANRHVPPREAPQRLCQFDIEGIAACPWNRPTQLPTAHRSRVSCRYFELRATSRGIVSLCTRPPD
jgi:hypothetical protein